MNVAELRKMVEAIPREFDSFNVEFASRVEEISYDHWIREDHPVSGSFIDQDNHELVLAGNEQLLKIDQYAR